MESFKVSIMSAVSSHIVNHNYRKIFYETAA